MNHRFAFLVIILLRVIDSFCYQKSFLIQFNRLGIRGYKIQLLPLRPFLLPERDDSTQVDV